ncbi:hypothetical protein [Streptomyces sp. AM 2-1-1]|uniref:hypothetical protein n=1 Tax=Streptomyces sp. AM 2-1-1 TaxID=3028709 RepID=UPI0023B99C1E|nr:hypothetical protein [Streptomyces sp. AM 2-1-1]WEH42134.1 hypothetical protein PZB77_23025 [Streptomyces sp. AM 2-1-1]
MRRLGRSAAGLAVATVLGVTASGCVTVHGELERVPAATESEAARALEDFLTAYNAADTALDPALDAGRVTGALGAINQAGLKARATYTEPGGEGHDPLELSDAHYVIPRKAGWPRYFFADADSNRDEDGGDGDTRWLLVFERTGPDAPWKVPYLGVVAPSRVPEFARDADGLAKPAESVAGELVVAPDELSSSYTGYLSTGAPDVFAAGGTTSGWRAARAGAKKPGFSYQYVDRPLDGAFRPFGLATKDGGALVFFSSKHFERQTAAQGLKPEVNRDTKALLSGEVKSTLTKERVSSQLVYVPAAGAAGGGKVTVLNRLPGLVAATGE